MTLLLVFIAAFFQTTSFSLVSRARNRNHMGYHAAASVLSNGLWFATMGILVTHDMSWVLAVPYIAGTVLGSLFGAKLSMKIEELLGATT
jgi:uncharacterized membrane protein YfcA